MKCGYVVVVKSTRILNVLAKQAHTILYHHLVGWVVFDQSMTYVNIHSASHLPKGPVSFETDRHKCATLRAYYHLCVAMNEICVMDGWKDRIGWAIGTPIIHLKSRRELPVFCKAEERESVDVSRSI